jgi:hypothetical protein
VYGNGKGDDKGWFLSEKLWRGSNYGSLFPRRPQQRR